MASEVPAGSASELATLYPAPRTVHIAGRAVEIKRCSITQAGRIADIGAPILAAREATCTFPQWVEEFPSEACEVIVAATGLDPQWVAGLSDDDRFDLASHLLEVNAGFFVQRRLPQLARMRRAWDQLLLGDGATPSSISTQTDIPTPATTRRKRVKSGLLPSPAPNGASGATA